MFPYEEFCKNIVLPNMIAVKQVFERFALEDPIFTLGEELKRPEIAAQIKPGQKIAITAGSRGVANIKEVLKYTVDFCKEKGAEPFLVPAMGSHGGAEAEGQLEVLAGYGITPETMGCPIKSSMETVVVGYSEEGDEVYVDKNAMESDGIILINRVKPHTAFTGRHESGLMKMMTIGLGKQKGAESCHAKGYKYMAQRVEEFGNIILEKAPVILGIALVENAFDKTCEIKAALPKDIEQMDAEMLKRAKALMGKILIDNADVLIVDEIGKNISGEGADPSVTGLCPTPYKTSNFQAQKAVVLGLTKEAHGCGYGVGQFHAIPKSLYDSMDMNTSYANSMTSRLPEQSRIPMVFSTDEMAVKAAIKTCCDIDYDNPKIVRIKNTAELETIWVSESLIPEVEKDPRLVICGEPKPLFG